MVNWLAEGRGNPGSGLNGGFCAREGKPGYGEGLEEEPGELICKHVQRTEQP